MVRVIELPIQGRCRVDQRTKNLIQRLRPHEIAVVDHIDLDDIAADALLQKRIKALINAAPSLSGRYPALGTSKLLNAGIPVIDRVGSKILAEIHDGSIVRIDGNRIYVNDRVFTGRRLELQELTGELTKAEQNLNQQLERFALNTMDFALREMKSIFAPLPLPPLKTSLEKKHVLIVVRGPDYREDLQAIRPYIDEVKPVLIGVDGGADALLEEGYRPHIILGDMDSVSDKALGCGAEIIVHAYPNGIAPGKERVEKLNLPHHILPAPGTSEDVSFLLAFEAGAELIIAVGTHTTLLDFLNKGRAGMASTFLVRLKVGNILIDAKGVNKLYRQRLRGAYLAKILAAALLPISLIAVIHPNLYQLMRLVWIKFRLQFGF
ncbi:MAG TPA: hypothetical protein GXX34_03265 [Clostridia bacterium]|nr:hypothetical protein [Clostridia bacterium]